MNVKLNNNKLMVKLYWFVTTNHSSMNALFFKTIKTQDQYNQPFTCCQSIIQIKPLKVKEHLHQLLKIVLIETKSKYASNSCFS